jgi:hypothetical protein
VKIPDGQDYILGEDAVSMQDSQHLTPLAMAWKPRPAQRAPPAGNVDFATHACVGPTVHPALDDFTHEFVAQNAAEALVPTGDLQVGITYSRGPYAYECFVVPGPGYVYIRADPQCFPKGEREQLLQKGQGTTMTTVPVGVQFHRNNMGPGGILTHP